MAYIFPSRDYSFTQKQIQVQYLISKAKLQASLAFDFQLQPALLSVLFQSKLKTKPRTLKGL